MLNPIIMKLNPVINRQDFIRKTVMGAAGILLPLPFLSAQSQEPEKPAPLKLEIVKEFVGVCHGKFDRAKEMLENSHLLLHASNDWGGGDFESGIEAAGHVGNKEIAAYLLSKGARYNIYLACMLGHLDIVKNVLTFNPGLLNSKGPHGFTMLHHAQKGGAESQQVVEYLQSLGAKETRIPFYTS
jgi:hypothetical protein